MKGLSLGALRNGKRYYLINYGERHEFEIEQILADGNFRVKDLTTLERYLLLDLMRYGKGDDFEIRDLDN
ncbi:MAG: hypothetical protein ACO263_01860 [Cyclobacteriaceae bacterium]